MTSATVDIKEVSSSTSVDLTPEASAKLDKVSELIASAAKWSVASALIPIPHVDVIVIGGIQANLINNIAKVYGSSFTKESVRSLATLLVGTLAPALGTDAVIGSTIKYVPGYGSLVGFVSMSAFSVAATYAIGKVMVKHFEGGGTAENFNVDSIKADLKSEFQKAVKK
jgi:uncharacterized protein (DUF697 family)